MMFINTFAKPFVKPVSTLWQHPYSPFDPWGITASEDELSDKYIKQNAEKIRSKHKILNYFKITCEGNQYDNVPIHTLRTYCEKLPYGHEILPDMLSKTPTTKYDQYCSWSSFVQVSQPYIDTTQKQYDRLLEIEKIDNEEKLKSQLREEYEHRLITLNDELASYKHTVEELNNKLKEINTSVNNDLHNKYERGYKDAMLNLNDEINSLISLCQRPAVSVSYIELCLTRLSNKLHQH